jgi:activator of HSP90 ATPase
MAIEFEVVDWIPAPPKVVYAAWLDSAEHSAMTGGVAVVSDQVGGAFEAWDGYIRGQNVLLEPPRRIVQRWRTVEFAPEDEDSLLEIALESAEQGTRLTIRHSNLPAHGMQYQQGWIDAYLTPMKAYFGD